MTDVEISYPLQQILDDDDIKTNESAAQVPHSASSSSSGLLDSIIKNKAIMFGVIGFCCGAFVAYRFCPVHVDTMSLSQRLDDVTSKILDKNTSA